MNTETVAGAWPDLAKRAISAVIMAALALAADWFGGWPFALFWIGAGIIVLVEWEWIVLHRRWPIVVGGITVLTAGLLAALDLASAAVVAILAGAAVVYIARRPEAGRHLGAVGVAYACAICVPIILLRDDAVLGAIAVLFIFAIVWGTDVMAYFVGRAIGGPKLWVRISPKKTWSGFIGGVVFGACAGVLVAWSTGLSISLALAAVAFVLSSVSQAGDLFESWVKRRFGAKDASHLIPGHGGFMDRLDGFVAASTLAALIAGAREPSSLATGLLVW